MTQNWKLSFLEVKSSVYLWWLSSSMAILTMLSHCAVFISLAFSCVLIAPVPNVKSKIRCLLWFPRCSLLFILFVHCLIMPLIWACSVELLAAVLLWVLFGLFICYAFKSEVLLVECFSVLLLFYFFTTLYLFMLVYIETVLYYIWQLLNQAVFN